MQVSRTVAQAVVAPLAAVLRHRGFVGLLVLRFWRVLRRNVMLRGILKPNLCITAVRSYSHLLLGLCIRRTTAGEAAEFSNPRQVVPVQYGVMLPRLGEVRQTNLISSHLAKKSISCRLRITFRRCSISSGVRRRCQVEASNRVIDVSQCTKPPAANSASTLFPHSCWLSESDVLCFCHSCIAVEPLPEQTDHPDETKSPHSVQHQ